MRHTFQSGQPYCSRCGTFDGTESCKVVEEPVNPVPDHVEVRHRLEATFRALADGAKRGHQWEAAAAYDRCADLALGMTFKVA
jgi:hypothetical protein